MIDSLDTLWNTAASRLSQRLGEDSFDRWFSCVRLMKEHGGQVTVGVPDDIHQYWIESNYRGDLESTLSELSGKKTKVEVQVFEGLEERMRETVPTEISSDRSSMEMELEKTFAPRAEEEFFELELAGGNRDVAPRSTSVPSLATCESDDAPEKEQVLDERTRKKIEECGLNDDNTFDTYVVGTHNRFAHAAAIAVGKAPARSYNPLFLHGGTGLGKTHLMQSIGHKLIRGRKRVRVVYLTCERFTNEFIDAIQRNSLTPFRERYRSADVLLIDDIQFLMGKERSQEEFFHTFNALFDSQKQIVITSDRPAAEIKNLEPRLVSRFEWGLTAELQAPDQETRTAILRRKAQQWGVQVDDDIVQFLAERIRNNVRRLEGGLMRLASYASLSGERLGMDECEHLLRDILQQESKKTITIDGIQRKVAEHYDVRLADMSSKRRPAHIAFARQVAMYLCRHLTKASLADIGEAFGGRDHGTVIYACKKVDERSKREETVRRALTLLEDGIRRG